MNTVFPNEAILQHLPKFIFGKKIKLGSKDRVNKFKNVSAKAILTLTLA